MDGLRLFQAPGVDYVLPANLVVETPPASTGTTTIEQNGTTVNTGTALTWVDSLHPLIGQRLFSAAGRIDYNYDEVAVKFQSNCRYPDDFMCILAQINHDWAVETDITGHMHWIQDSAAVPNWLIRYRWHENGETTPAWINVALTNSIYTYVAGTILQIHDGMVADATGIITVSNLIDIKIYRDVTNASGLFVGAEGAPADQLAKEFDLHYLVDMSGSRAEYDK